MSVEAVRVCLKSSAAEGGSCKIFRSDVYGDPSCGRSYYLAVVVGCSSSVSAISEVVEITPSGVVGSLQCSGSGSTNFNESFTVDWSSNIVSSCPSEPDYYFSSTSYITNLHVKNPVASVDSVSCIEPASVEVQGYSAVGNVISVTFTGVPDGIEILVFQAGYSTSTLWGVWSVLSRNVVAVVS